jgi:hypothetical protein
MKMDLNLMELEYMLQARKAEVEENTCVVENLHFDHDEKKQKYCMRIFGFEICLSF